MRGILSNGSSLFQEIGSVHNRSPDWYSLNPLKRVKFISIFGTLLVKDIGTLSQSPQTGQVYFNMVLYAYSESVNGKSLNPLKRVKFISMENDKIENL